MMAHAEAAEPAWRRWIMWLIGLAVVAGGIYLVMATSGGRARGACFESDTTMIADGVTRQECMEMCSTGECTWQG